MRTMIVLPNAETRTSDLIDVFRGDPHNKFSRASNFEGIMLRSGEVVSTAPLTDVSENTWTAFDFDAFVRNDDNGNPVWYEYNPAQSIHDWEAHLRQLIREVAETHPNALAVTADLS